MTLSLSRSLARRIFLLPPDRARSVEFFYFIFGSIVEEISRLLASLEERGIITCPGQMLKNASHRQPLVIPILSTSSHPCFAQRNYGPGLVSVHGISFSPSLSLLLSLSLSFSGSLVRINIFKNTKVDERSGGGKQL